MHLHSYINISKPKESKQLERRCVEQVCVVTTHLIPNLTHLEKKSKVRNVFKMRCHNAFIKHAIGTCSNCYHFYHVWGFYHGIHFLFSDISFKLSVLISFIFIFIDTYFIYIFPGRRGSGRLPLIPYLPIAIGQPLYEKKNKKV